MIFDHIGIFVHSIPLGRKFFEKTLTIKKKSKIIKDDNLRVKIQFLYDKKNIRYELISGLGKNNPVDNTLNKNVNIINHIAYRTNKFEKIIKSMKAQGNLQISQPKNAKAFRNKKVVFFLTKLGFIIELIEE